MELYKEILIRALTRGEVAITFADLDIEKIVEGECYKALEKIQAVIWDDTLDDRECFMKIEEIICVFEELGSNGGNRHDFG